MTFSPPDFVTFAVCLLIEPFAIVYIAMLHVEGHIQDKIASILGRAYYCQDLVPVDHLHSWSFRICPAACPLERVQCECA